MDSKSDYPPEKSDYSRQQSAGAGHGATGSRGMGDELPPPAYPDATAQPPTAYPRDPSSHDRAMPYGNQGYPSQQSFYPPQGGQYPMQGSSQFPMQGSSYADPPADPKSAYAGQGGAPYYPQQGGGYPAQGPSYAQGSPYPQQGSPYPAQGFSYSNAGSPYPGPSSPFAAGPSSGMQGMPPPPSSQSSQDRLKGFAPGQSIVQLMTPPPQAFQRTPPQNLPYPPFEPTVLPGLSNRLEDGFSSIPPPYHGPYHPFATHDVNEEDWRCFLGQIKRAGSLSPVNRIVAQVAPMAMGLSLPMGMLISHGIESHMKKDKGGPVGELVDHWNYYFFHPRYMHATLAQGGMTYTGSDNVPPDMVGRRGSSKSREYDDSSSSSSSSDDNRRGGRRERKQARRERKRERKAKKRDFKQSSNEKWRLILTFNPPSINAYGMVRM